MDVIFEGAHDGNQAEEQLMSVIRLFKDRYHINHFREMHLVMTLVDETGEDVELVDTETSQVYRTFEVVRSVAALKIMNTPRRLKLVIDNT